MNIIGNFLKRLLNVFLAIICISLSFESEIIGIINPAQKLTYAETVQSISKNQVENIKIFTNDSDAEIYLKEDEQRYITEIPNETVFCEFVQETIKEGNDLNIIKRRKRKAWLNIIYFLVGIMFLKRAFKRENDSETKVEFSKPFSLLDTSYEVDYNNNFVKSEIRFSDVAGLREEKEELVEVIEALKNPSKYTEMGAKIPKGILLSGEPGTGKTLLAKAVAGEADVSFLAVSGTEFDDKYVGVGASRIRKLFEAAKENTPCIIFIDEIDAVGQKRTSSEERWSTQTIEQLLVEMDGFNTQSNVIVLAATNRPKTLDPALTRPGRFDRNIIVNLPDVQDREEILKIHGKNKKFMDDVNFIDIAHNTAGYSGAELENILDEAARIAVRKEESAISKSSIDEALKKIKVGLQKKGRKISEKERKLVAYHEAGHAVLSKFLSTQDNVKEVSIIPRGTSGGYNWSETVEDKSYLTKTELTERMVILLGGRAAEEIALNDISNGASYDLEVATQIAREMICVYGMNQDVGPISLVDAKDEMIGTETMSLIIKLIAESVKKAEQKAKRLLSEHKEFLDNVAKVLLEKETISGNELDEIFETYQNNHRTNL